MPATLVALTGLPGMGPRRLRWLLSVTGGPEAAWSAVRAGRPPVPPGTPPAVTERWRSAAAGVDPARVAGELRAAGCVAVPWGDPRYPEALAGDPDAPAVLFIRGDPGHARRPGVAIVGTRRCTRYGRDIARSWGTELATAGIAVVSGLAVGIDGAAHGGCLAAGGVPVGVVGSGPDVVYPARHRDLWEQVGLRGLLVSECPPGTRPEPWRFPARNRIIAALARAVVVVESHTRGGALITAELAAERGRPVLAVPGPIHSAASEGTNRLIADGALVATSVTDVLEAAGLTPGVPVPPPAPGAAPDPGDGGTAPGAPVPADGAPADPDPRAVVLDALGWVPRTFDDLCRATGMAPTAAAETLEELRRRGVVARRGPFWEQRS